jgi:hypothetical protein
MLAGAATTVATRTAESAANRLICVVRMDALRESDHLGEHTASPPVICVP